MPHAPWTAACLALSLATALPAQRTWIVDHAKGAGYDFPAIQPAVQAARAGDVVIVRPGVYAGFTCDKGIRILGTQTNNTRVYAPERAPTPVQIRDLPAHETFAMARIEVKVFSKPRHIAQITIANCAGPVVLEEVRTVGATPIDTAGDRGLQLSRCRAVTLNSCLVGFGMLARSCKLTASNTTFRRYDSVREQAAFPAVELIDSHAILADCTAVGAAKFVTREATSGLVATRSDISLRAGCVCLAGAGVGKAAGVRGDTQSVLERDPRTFLEGSGGAKDVEGFRVVTAKTLPSLRVIGGALGQELFLEVVGGDGDMYALSVSTTALPMTIAPYGDLWIDPRFRIYLIAGFHGLFGSESFTLRLPAEPKLVGTVLGWQVLGGPWPKVIYSNAVATTLR